MSPKKMIFGENKNCYQRKKSHSLGIQQELIVQTKLIIFQR